MTIAVREVHLFVRNLTLRVPFRYGIATMTHAPHLVVRMAAEIDGRLQVGFSADNLPPKWFTKNPDTSFDEEIADMIGVAQAAAEFAQALTPQESVFAWWRAIVEMQKGWATARHTPALLAQFGVSLIERAMIDAFCRATGRNFGQALRENAFGVQLGEVHPELAGVDPVSLLPTSSSRTMIVRHTVGLADPIEDHEVHGASDGLPHSLEEFIRDQGLTHFKFKLGGDIEQDRVRLRRIAAVILRHTGSWAFTLDGNENFRTVAPFRALWEALRADETLAEFLAGLIFVEQPFHRDIALKPETTADLLSWAERPPMIIDESDAGDDALRIALVGGYAGTSHKNCKGVFHGLANVCLIENRRRAEPARPWHLSGEDLTNLGPIALHQDLAAVAAFGLEHVERNGHHYFAGLSQFPENIQREVGRHHGDLYARHPTGYPAVRIEQGNLHIGSVVDAPFGVGFEPDLSEFIPVEEWRAWIAESSVLRGVDASHVAGGKSGWQPSTLRDPLLLNSLHSSAKATGIHGPRSSLC